MGMGRARSMLRMLECSNAFDQNALSGIFR